MHKSITWSWQSMSVGAIAALAITGGVVFAALSAHAAQGPSVTASIVNGSNQSVASVALGAPVHAQVIVASSTSSTTPTGTVGFNVYPNTSCMGTPSAQTGIALVNGTAQSATTTVGAAGLSYMVHYDGDATNTPADSQCTAVAVTAPQTALSLGLSTTSAAVGTFVHASAGLSSTTNNAGGSVAYTVYTNNTCSAGAQADGIKSVSNGTIPDSDAIQFNLAGSYYFQAVYSGDANNAAATSSCVAASIFTPVVAPTTGHIITDVVTNPANASTTFSFNTTGSGFSSFSLSDQSTVNNQQLNPGAYTLSEVSSSGWTLTSATCSLNGAASTTYAPGSTLTLNAGDTITCTFLNTKQGTSTINNGGDNDQDDHGGNGDHGKPEFENGHDNGKHLGQIKHGTFASWLAKHLGGTHGSDDSDNEQD